MELVWKGAACWHLYSSTLSFTKMASVSSLDQDLRRMRLDKYTPQAAQEVRDWIEEMLGDKLPDGDLLDALRDGMILCRWVDVPCIVIKKLMTPGLSTKQSHQA